jgi:hypothetical protein
MTAYCAFAPFIYENTMNNAWIIKKRPKDTLRLLDPNSNSFS